MRHLHQSCSVAGQNLLTGFPPSPPSLFNFQFSIVQDVCNSHTTSLLNWREREISMRARGCKAGLNQHHVNALAASPTLTLFRLNQPPDWIIKQYSAAYGHLNLWTASQWRWPCHFSPKHPPFLACKQGDWQAYTVHWDCNFQSKYAMHVNFRLCLS